MSERRPIRLKEGYLSIEHQDDAGRVFFSITGWTEKGTRYEVELFTDAWTLRTLSKQAAKVTRERIERAQRYRQTIESAWHRDGE
jgi:hypothetical protein